MINNKISTEDKLELVYKFYQEIWGTNLIKDERSSPPTPEAMLKNIKMSTFPAIKILEVEDLWHKARMFYYMGGDESMLKMEGDKTKEENELELQQFHDSFIESQRIEELLDRGDEADEPEIQAYEKRVGIRYVRFPKTTEREYTGLFESYKYGQLKLDTTTQTFPAYNLSLDAFDLTRPITVCTIEIKTKEKTYPETVEKIMQENLS